MRKTATEKRHEPISREHVEELTLMQLVTNIVNLAKESGFTQEFGDEVKPFVEQLAAREKITEHQALFFSLVIRGSLCGGDSPSDMARFMRCEDIVILPYLSDIEELERQGFINEMQHMSCKTYEATDEALNSLRHNKPFVRKDYKGMTVIALLSTMQTFTRKLARDNMSYEKFYREMERMMNDNKQLPLLQSIDKLGLEPNVALILLQFCRCLMLNNMVDLRLGDFLNIGKDIAWRNEQAYALTHGEHELILMDLLEFGYEEGMRDTNKFRLTDKARRLLLPDYKGQKETETESMDVIACKDIGKKDLFFDDEVKKQVDRLADLLKESNYKRICKQLKANGFRSGFSTLFYGEPGTGKTESALQLARLTKRDVMQVNISEVRSMWVGESEKNVKRIFDEYRQLVKTSKRCPILLFNEADAIISQRKRGGGSSIDKMENTMQNIILQEMEQMEGILIATTNLACNMDKAFERRFIYKVEFRKPTLEARMAIWHSMMPTLKKSTLEALAHQYAFSGGQIENIARKSKVDQILYGKTGNDLSQIEEFCESEMLDKKAHVAPIGFAV